MILKLHKFNLTLAYKRGKQLYLADTLSCAHRKVTKQHLNDEDECGDDCPIDFGQPVARAQITHWKRCLSAKSVQYHQTQTATQNSANAAEPFIPFQDKLNIKDGIIMKGRRAVIPQTLQSEYLHILHKGHAGVFCFLVDYDTGH